MACAPANDRFQRIKEIIVPVHALPQDLLLKACSINRHRQLAAAQKPASKKLMYLLCTKHQNLPFFLADRSAAILDKVDMIKISVLSRKRGQV
jgi:hypothetical protein